VAREIEAPLLSPRREDGVTRVTVDDWVVEVAVRDRTVDVQIASPDTLPRGLASELHRELAEGGYSLGEFAFEGQERRHEPERPAPDAPTPARRAAAARAWQKHTRAIA
jgi:hypothetical protein